jgi:hypothetical protein
LDSEAAKTPEIRLFNVINNEKRKEKYAADQFFSNLLEITVLVYCGDHAHDWAAKISQLTQVYQ